MEDEVIIRILTKNFYEKYPPDLYPELMSKPDRPYACLLIEIFNDFVACVPFRSAISHHSAYLFKGSKRSRRTKSGLDYTKIILIDELDYISSASAVVDDDEYAETIKNLNKITSGVYKYINDYYMHMTKEKILNEATFNRKYKYSTLKYFHDVLRI